MRSAPHPGSVFQCAAQSARAQYGQAVRLKENSSSWRARGVIRRDFRHAHGDPETPRRRGRRKDTHRFCRGNPNKPHQLPAVELPDFGPNPVQRVEVECERCGALLVLTRKGELFEKTPYRVMGTVVYLHTYMYDGPPKVRRDPLAERARLIRKRERAYRQHRRGDASAA